MSIAPVNFTGIPQKKEKKNTNGALLATSGGVAAFNLAQNIVAPSILKNFLTPSSELTEEEISIVGDGAKKVFSELTNLSKKGVKFNDYQSVPKYCTADTGNFKEDIKTGITVATDILYARPIANGKNVFFIREFPAHSKEAAKRLGLEKNSININMKKLPLASFHEMGHAFNSNNSTFWKTMQKLGGKCRPLALLFILIPALTKETKAQEGRELTKKEKFVNNLRKASPLLAGASMLPMILEEGKATLRANNWAKEVFKNTPDLIKKVTKTNKWGLISYIAISGAAILASLTAKKIRDFSDAKFASNIQNTKNMRSENSFNYHQG